MPKARLRSENAKIIATLGPRSRSLKEIRALAEAGADVFRLNFSHGSHEDHRLTLEMVRKVEGLVGRPLAAMADLQGPKVRVGSFPGGEMKVAWRSEYPLVAAATTDASGTIPVPHKAILDQLAVGDTILVDDGKLIFTVMAAGAAPRVRADVPGKISDKKGFTVRGKALPVKALTDKDKADLEFALSIGVDIVALSFVQSVSDISMTKAIIRGRVPLIAKLEKPAALGELREIIHAADGVMVARGDLGVEYPPEEVPVIQRRIIRAARAAGRPVIVATQMLESMIENSAPTRAEASDVATAIYQGADAVMLSAETAVGRHPATAVAIMSRIIRATENAEDYRRSLIQFDGDSTETSAIDVIAKTATEMAEAEGAAALALRTGAFERLARFARVRGTTPILYGSMDQSRVRQACLLWGVHPQKLDAAVENWYRALMKAAGLDGRVAYARWAGDDTRFAWEIGIGKGLDGKPITGV